MRRSPALEALCLLLFIPSHGSLCQNALRPALQPEKSSPLVQTETQPRSSFPPPETDPGRGLSSCCPALDGPMAGQCHLRPPT